MSINLINPASGATLTQHGDVLTDIAGNTFKMVNGAWRFVPEGNYADNFGFQWNKFRLTQIDKFVQGLDQSTRRFLAVSGWDKIDLKDKNILEVGSGAGRFTHVVLKHTNGTLYSVDYSNAVEANFSNNGPNPRLHLFQASVYELPFAGQQFDKVFCFGVLQHTPNVRESVRALVNMVRPGGELVVDFYPVKGWYTRVHAKYLFRPFTKSMAPGRLLGWIEKNVDRFTAIYRFLNKAGLGVFNRFLPICDINATIPASLDDKARREWIILDTFDMFSPAYDQPQKIETVKRWFTEFGLVDVSGGSLNYEGSNSVTFVRGVRR